MVLNDFRKDFASLLKLEGIKQKEIIEKTGISQSSISNAIARPQFNKVFVSAVEAAGYDIQVSYIRKPTSN